MAEEIAIFWFRRDLRLEDNVGLQTALKSGLSVLPIFIFDTDILYSLELKKDRRVDYIHQALQHLKKQLKELDSDIKVLHGKALEQLELLTKQFNITAVFCNGDYEPYALKRDQEVRALLSENNIEFHSFKDQVIFEKSEVFKKDGTPYTVFTPYSKKWKERLAQFPITFSVPNLSQLLRIEFDDFPSLQSLGFHPTQLIFETPMLEKELILHYDRDRNIPGLDRTTYLGIALRFGTISIRKCVEFANHTNQTWLNELIWREFFMQILFHFPRVVSQSFKVKYDFIQWRNNDSEFQAWCEGETGYPIVDAGMKQLKETGFMHNRVRMIVASFLCKHLLIDWRWGEAYFAQHLNDYELASNNGNWQWAAGSGCDAAPYFRIFNPTTQTKKFDPDLSYIRRWHPEYETDLTPPIVNHEFARARALETYKAAVQTLNQ